MVSTSNMIKTEPSVKVDHTPKSRVSGNDEHLTESNKDSMSACSEHRLDQVKSGCKILNKTQMSLSEMDLTYLYVDEMHKVVACLPPKTGCTTWKMIIANNSGEEPLDANLDGKSLHYDGMKPYNVERLKAYPKHDIDRILKDYYKMMVIRHPVERIVSTYLDKLVSNKSLSWRQYLGEKVLKRLHPDLSEAVKEKGEGVTFNDFVQYIIQTSSEMNPHWRPVSRMCHPCIIQYDYIVKLETQRVDASRIIHWYFGPYFRGVETISKKKGQGAGSGQKGGRLLQQYANITKYALDELLKLGYEEDLMLFGYGITREGNGVRTFCKEDIANETCC